MNIRRHKSPLASVDTVQALFRGDAGFSNGEVVDRMGQEIRQVQQGRSYLFNSTTDAVLVPDNILLTAGTGDFTMTAWVFLTNTTVGVLKTIYADYIYGGSAATDNGWFFTVLPSGGINRLYWASAQSGSYVGGFSNFDLSLNTWHFVACTRTLGTVTFFVDGTQRGTVTDGSRNLTAREKIFGNYRSGVGTPAPFNSPIHSFTYYNRVLSLAEMDTIRLRNVYSLTNLQILFKCDEGGGNLCVNSGLLNNLTDGTTINANLNTFHQLRTDGFGADWQNQVGFTPAIRILNGQQTAVVNNAMIAITPVFTLDFYWLDTVSTITRGMVEMRLGAGNTYFQLYTGNNNLNVVLAVGGVIQFVFTGAFTFAVNTRYHIQFVRNNADAYLFVDGNIIASTTTALLGIANTDNINFGRLPSNAPSYSGEGFMWNIRFARIARNVVNFTRPTTASDYNLNESGLVYMITNNQFVFNPFNLALANTSTGILVPRDELNPTFDAFGEPLFYKNRVKYNVALMQSNCLTFNGSTNFVPLL